MRLGQLARKYDVSTQEIISYLKKLDPTNGTIHPNAKLDEHTELLVAKHFDVLLDFTEKPSAEFEEVEEEFDKPVNVPLPEITEVLPPIVEEEIKPPAPEVRVKEPMLKEEETITSDRLLELMESEENTVDLSKITRITAAKRELDGLKVLGKIELPEPRKKASDKSDEKQEKQRNSDRNTRNQRPQVSPEEAEKQRLWGKMKKEENDARLELRRKEKEKEELKAMKEAHYKQKLQTIKPRHIKQKESLQQIESVAIEEVQQRPVPKTVLGKFWKWLNT